MKVVTSIFCLFVLIASGSFAQQIDLQKLMGPYLGQKPPGETPEIFAPGIVSTGFHEHGSPAFSPDGKEIYWSAFINYHSVQVILFMKNENGIWTRPQLASFSGQYSDGGPVFSIDGNTIFFYSYRPVNEYELVNDDIDIWMVQRTKTGWGNPQHLGWNVNSEKSDWPASISKNGTLYFSSDRNSGKGETDIYFSEVVGHEYSEPKNIGDSINSKAVEYGPFIDPDENYLIFCAYGRNDGYGSGDLYISFRKNEGSWTKAKNMGERINSEFHERFPSVTYDRKFLFFTSDKRSQKSYFEKRLDYNQIIRKTNQPGNGFADIYWISSELIEDLRPDKQ